MTKEENQLRVILVWKKNRGFATRQDMIDLEYLQNKSLADLQHNHAETPMSPLMWKLFGKYGEDN